MKLVHITLGLICLVISAAFITACTRCSGNESLQTNARKKLEAAHRNFTERDFIQSLRDRDMASALLFLDAGIDPDTEDEAGMTALSYAVHAGNLPLVKTLLEKGAHLNIEEKTGQTPLTVSIAAEQYDIARFLIQQGANLNPSSRIPITPLMYACDTEEEEMPEFIEFLIKKGAKVDTRDQLGRTALMYAVGTARLKSAQVLVNAGADVNAVDNQGHNVLFFLSGNGERAVRDPIVAFLTSKGAR